MTNKEKLRKKKRKRAKRLAEKLDMIPVLDCARLHFRQPMDAQCREHQTDNDSQQHHTVGDMWNWTQSTSAPTGWLAFTQPAGKVT
jgi:hypothetical protein